MAQVSDFISNLDISRGAPFKRSLSGSFPVHPRRSCGAHSTLLRFHAVHGDSISTVPTSPVAY